MTKIAIYHSHWSEFNITQHPEEFRPIGLCRDKWELTGDLDEADWIYFPLHYLNCNAEYENLRFNNVYEKYRHKAILYAMHDSPTFAYHRYTRHGVKFIAQPLEGKRTNEKYSIVSVPLQMRKFELEVIKDKKFIEEIRCIPKDHDFCFIGQTGYEGRNYFRPKNLPLPRGSKYLFSETQPIWEVKDLAERVEMTKEFCRDVASSKFCFAPRGIGSSSFRLYQSLMSGTIPIIYGMKDRPFTDDLNWDEFSVNGDLLSVIEPNFEAVLDLDLDKMRERAIEVWDNYFHMEKTDQYLFEKYLEKK